MKRVLLVWILSAGLCSCSLLQRRGVDEDGEIRDSEPNAEAPLFTPNGQEVTSVNGGGSTGANALESEVARLNTKVAALETKLDVLSANVEKIHAHRSQPVIEAEVASPQANLAVPVNSNQEITETPPQISAAPAKAFPIPMAKSAENPITLASGAEKDFRAGMQLFQNGQNVEASSRFSAMAKKYPGHLLAAHALYWAGESAMRAQQTALALENWGELEKRYPRSAYMPETLAGLAKAHEAQGDTAKAKDYRSMLLRSFPKSPVALRFQPEQGGGESAPPVARRIHNPEPAAAPPEEEAPAYESDDAGEKAEQ